MKLLRNEIFARHGFIFKDQKLNEFFSEMEFYVPDESFDPGTLNEFEKENITFLKEQE